MNYVRVGGYIPPQPIEDYNDLPNIPVQNQDLAVSGFTPVANSYYRHIGATTASFTKGVIYYYNSTGYAALDGAAANNGTLTIQKNGTTVQTFTANQSSSVTANITVPTKASDVDALSLDGGTINKSKTIKMDASANSDGANLKWGTVNSKNPYIGYASDQVDGTFVVGSLLGTNYASGLAIGGGSGNLLWKGTKVATTSDIPTDYVPTAGGTVTGNLTVGGNLTVNGTTTTVDSTTLQVKDKLIEVAHGNTTSLTTPAGLVAPKYDGTSSGALVFDSTGTAYVGDVTLKDGNIDVANSGLQPLATRTGLVGGNLVQYDSSALTLKDSGKKISDLALKTDLSGKANLEGGNTFSGLQTINAPTNVSGSEQTTMKVKTSNGGAIVFGKEGPNSGTMIRLDQTDGTCRLRFRSSKTAGAMVWEQPEQGAKLHVDLGKDGSDKHRVTFPSSAGTLALTSQIPTNYVTTDTEQTISGAKTFTSDVVVNKTTPKFNMKLSGLTNGTTPSDNQFGEFCFLDKNGVYEGGIRFDSPTNGENRTKLSTNSFGTTHSNYVGLFAKKNASSATATDIWRFIPNQDAVIDLGQSDLRWRNVRAVTTYSNVYGSDLCSTSSLRLKDSNITRGTNQAASGGKQNYYRAININDKNNHKGVAVEWGYLCEKNSNGNTTKHVSELNLLVYPPNTTDNANFVKVALGKRSDGTTYFTYAGDQVVTTQNFSLSGTTLTITL